MTQQHDMGREDPGDNVRQQAAKAGESLKKEFSAIGDSARDTAHAEARDKFEKGKDVVDENVEALSNAVEDAANRLSRDDHPLASYADELSSQLGRLSSTIQNSSLDDVASRAHRLARENPGLFMLGSIALGIAAARFAKASDDRDHRSPGYSDEGMPSNAQAASVRSHQQSREPANSGQESARPSATSVGVSNSVTAGKSTPTQQRGEMA